MRGPPAFNHPGFGDQAAEAVARQILVAQLYTLLLEDAEFEPGRVTQQQVREAPSRRRARQHGGSLELNEPTVDTTSTPLKQLETL